MRTTVADRRPAGCSPTTVVNISKVSQFCRPSRATRRGIACAYLVSSGSYVLIRFYEGWFRSSIRLSSLRYGRVATVLLRKERVLLAITTELGSRVTEISPQIFVCITDFVHPLYVAVFIRGLYQAFESNPSNQALQILIHSYIDVQV